MKLSERIKYMGYAGLLAGWVISQGGCKKLVDVSAPTTTVSSADVYASDATAIAVLTALYIDMSQANYAGNNYDITTTSFFAGLSADELTLYSGSSSSTEQAYYDNALSATSSNNAGADMWGTLYAYIYTTNSAIAGLTASTTLTASVRLQLLGEAQFMRALYYFYLVNFYGNVPLALSENYTVTENLAQSTSTQVYHQIVWDLLAAQGELSSGYVGSLGNNTTSERTRPNKWAATALLARVYLYEGVYDSAAIEASQVIGNTSLYSLVGLDSVFLANSQEAIWQLQPVTTGVTNTQDANVFVLPSSGPNNSNMVYLSPELLGAFEPGDARRADWVDSVIAAPDTFYYPFKYKVYQADAPVSEYTMILRLGEQYLIRAEAEAQQGNYAAAASDLDLIRTRANLPGYAGGMNKTSLLAALLHERQVELFTELGHRWLDLKRTGNVDQVMTTVTPLKSGGSPWQSYQQLYPILVSDLEADQNLKQNSGY